MAASLESFLNKLVSIITGDGRNIVVSKHLMVAPNSNTALYYLCIIAVISVATPTGPQVTHGSLCDYG